MHLSGGAEAGVRARVGGAEGGRGLRGRALAMPLAGLARGGAGGGGPGAGGVGTAAKGSAQLQRGGVASPEPQMGGPSAAVGAEQKPLAPAPVQPVTMVRPLQALPGGIPPGMVPGAFPGAFFPQPGMPAVGMEPTAAGPAASAAAATAAAASSPSAAPAAAQQQNAAAWAWYMAMCQATAGYAAMQQQYQMMQYAQVGMVAPPPRAAYPGQQGPGVQLPRVVVHPGHKNPRGGGAGGGDAKRRREGEAGAPGRDGKGRKKVQGEGGAATAGGDASSAKICSNCGTTHTPFWRKDKTDGQPLCNACGLYSAKNDAPRPAALWKAPAPAADKKARPVMKPGASSSSAATKAAAPPTMAAPSGAAGGAAMVAGPGAVAAAAGAAAGQGPPPLAPVLP